MPGWFTRFMRSLLAAAPKPTREALLNDGLELAMDWGENWLAPIQERLHRRHPHLQVEELDELNAASQEAMKFGHETAYQLVRAKGKNIDEGEFLQLVLVRYAWLSAENKGRLFRQSMYYAWKAGGSVRAAAAQAPDS